MTISNTAHLLHTHTPSKSMFWVTTIKHNNAPHPSRTLNCIFLLLTLHYKQKEVHIFLLQEARPYNLGVICAAHALCLGNISITQYFISTIQTKHCSIKSIYTQIVNASCIKAGIWYGERHLFQHFKDNVHTYKWLISLSVSVQVHI